MRQSALSTTIKFVDSNCHEKRCFFFSVVDPLSKDNVLDLQQATHHSQGELGFTAIKQRPGSKQRTSRRSTLNLYVAN